MTLAQVAFAAVLTAAQVVSTPAATSAPPVIAGATWTYRYTATDASSPGTPQVGTLTTIYGGPTEYRGRHVYYTDTSDTVTPDFTERDYYAWIGGHFRQVALETHSAGTVLEIVFDKTVPLDTEESASGSAETFQNGTYQGDVPWHTTVVSRGTVVVTVPAGTYRDALRWTTTFELGPIRQVQVADSVGLVDIRVETEHYISGALAATTMQELASGPVR